MTGEERKRATRERIQAVALRLFQERGFNATTVEEIATAAGVSHMTFFRHFPTKEDVVLSDGYDDLIVELIAQSPSELLPSQRICLSLLEGLRGIYEVHRDTLLAQLRLIVATPALRNRLWSHQLATQYLIIEALDVPEPDLHMKTQVAACLAAAATAMLTWTEEDGTAELPELLARAFDALHTIVWRSSPSDGG